MENITIKKLADLAEIHVDTLFKIKRGTSLPSSKLSKKLEKITGIDRRKWLYPDEFGNPWTEFDQFNQSDPPEAS